MRVVTGTSASAPPSSFLHAIANLATCNESLTKRTAPIHAATKSAPGAESQHPYTSGISTDPLDQQEVARCVALPDDGDDDAVLVRRSASRSWLQSVEEVDIRPLFAQPQCGDCSSDPAASTSIHPLGKTVRFDQVALAS